MIEGLELFKTKFKDYADCYVIIGGTACSILLEEEDVPFRTTRDIDMVLIAEDMSEEFAKLFWEYIKEGDYICGTRKDMQARFFRFTEPIAGYPKVIELFTRKEGYHHIESSSRIVPVHIDDDVSSLSAMLLDDEYYQLMKNGKRLINGISVLGEEYLIPFKMYAWINLYEDKLQGRHVNDRDLKKHKNDVFRLLMIISNDIKVDLTEAVRNDVELFIEKMSDEIVDEKHLQLPFSKETALQMLKKIYLQ